MKKLLCIFALILALTFTACSKNTDTIDQKEAYNAINTLVDGFTADKLNYEVVLTSEEMGISLTDTGSLENKDGTYTYTYSYQTLNKIGSGEESLISTHTGELTGTKDEVLSEGFEIDDGVSVLALDLKDSFKTHTVVKDGDSYVMSGYIARNTIIKNTEGLDSDIRFYYDLTVSGDYSSIEKLVIRYCTNTFDSIVITITF